MWTIRYDADVTRSTIHDARATGQACGSCGRRFGDRELRAVAHERLIGCYVVCLPCTGERAADWVGDACYGCTAPLTTAVLTVHDYHGDFFPVCSERCRQRVAKRAQRGQGVGLMWTGYAECEHCGESTAHMRLGAKFCSTRCRVAAHRAALREGAG